MMIIEFHGSVKPQGAVAVGSSAVLGHMVNSSPPALKVTADTDDECWPKPTKDQRSHRNRAIWKSLNRQMETEPIEKCRHQETPKHRQKEKCRPTINYCSDAPA